MATLKRFCRSDQASVAVEFAFVGPIVITTFLAMIEFGMVFFTMNSAQQAGWQAARQVATGRIRATDVPDLIRPQLPTWAQAGVTIPSASLANGIYTVTISLRFSDATPLHFATALYGSNIISLRASFQSEAN